MPTIEEIPGDLKGPGIGVEQPKPERPKAVDEAMKKHTPKYSPLDAADERDGAPSTFKPPVPPPLPSVSAEAVHDEVDISDVTKVVNGEATQEQVLQAAEKQIIVQAYKFISREL